MFDYQISFAQGNRNRCRNSRHHYSLFVEPRDNADLEDEGELDVSQHHLLVPGPGVGGVDVAVEHDTSWTVRTTVQNRLTNNHIHLVLVDIFTSSLKFLQIYQQLLN